MGYRGPLGFRDVTFGALGLGLDLDVIDLGVEAVLTLIVVRLDVDTEVECLGHRGFAYPGQFIFLGVPGICRFVGLGWYKVLVVVH